MLIEQIRYRLPINVAYFSPAPGVFSELHRKQKSLQLGTYWEGGHFKF